MLKIQARQYNTIVTISNNDNNTNSSITTKSGIYIPLPDTINISDLVSIIEQVDTIEDILIDLEPIKTLSND